jgi:hypothetical protein
MKLTAAQRRVLQEAADATGRDRVIGVHRPGPFKRMVRTLVSNGLLEYVHSTDTVRITEAGRSALSGDRP